MNDEELRAFLESATVGGDDEQQPKQASAADDAETPSKSFDELIAPGGGSEAELTPIVLPGPKSAQNRPFVSNDAPVKPPAAPPATPAAPPVVPVAPPAAPVADQGQRPVAASAASTASAGTPAFVGPPTLALPEVREQPDTIEGDYEKISVVGSEPKRGRLVPWLIVGAGAVVALIAAIFIVGALAGGGEEPAPTAAPTVPTEQPETSSPTTSRPTTPATTTPSATPSPTVPQVEVGPTMTMRITQWNTQVELSQKLGLTASYSIPDGVNLTLQTSLIDSLPATCSKDWGMTRRDDGTFEVFKPAERCEAAPEVYDELWGLMDAMVKSARSL